MKEKRLSEFWKEIVEILYREYERRNGKDSSEQNSITKEIVENGEVENTKQEFQTITLNGLEYHLIPKEISVGYIADYNEDIQLRVAKKEFEPFTLNIEINTLDEAKSLWNRFNLNYISLCEAMQSKYYKVESQNTINDMGYWKQLDNVLKDLGEKPDVK